MHISMSTELLLYAEIREHDEKHIKKAKKWAKEFLSSEWRKEKYPHKSTIDRNNEIAAAKLAEIDWWFILYNNRISAPPPDFSIGNYDHGYDVANYHIKCCIRNKPGFYKNGKPDNLDMAWAIYPTIKPGNIVLYATDASLLFSYVCVSIKTNLILPKLSVDQNKDLYPGKRFLYARNIGINQHHIDQTLLELTTKKKEKK